MVGEWCTSFQNYLETYIEQVGWSGGIAAVWLMFQSFAHITAGMQANEDGSFCLWSMSMSLVCFGDSP